MEVVIPFIAVSGGLYRAGSKKNLCGDPSEALFEAIELGKVDTVASLLDSGLVTKFNMYVCTLAAVFII